MSTSADATMAAAQAAQIPDAQPAATPPAAAGAAGNAAPEQHTISTPPREPAAKRQYVDAAAPVASEPWVVKREGDMCRST